MCVSVVTMGRIWIRQTITNTNMVMPPSHQRQVGGRCTLCSPSNPQNMHTTKWNTYVTTSREMLWQCRHKMVNGMLGIQETSETLLLGAAALETRHWWTSPHGV
ncbi:hypothetical protein B0T09DRAFT_122695 [Sordaria sp. MPI-SDFR-AT-0083]|nr:hypothetical protein B0T09DRAFT_122695 [Sordaria sp. MPI-SDFR-AT-0083]